MMGVLAQFIILFYLLVGSTTAQNSATCNLSGNITCTIKATGQTCDSYIIPPSSTCGLTLSVTYKFTYCNLNSDAVVLKDSTVLRSEYYNYSFVKKLPPVSCVTQSNSGVINTCKNGTSSASMTLNGYIPMASFNIWCYYYKFLRVQAKQQTQRPTRKPTWKKKSRKPTERPTKHPTSKPTTKRSPKPSQKPSTKPSLYPSGHPSLKPSVSKPSTKPIATLKPSLKPLDLKPSKKPSHVRSVKPSTRPSVNKTSKPSKKPSLFPTSRSTMIPSGNPIVSDGLKISTSKPSLLPTLLTLPSSRPSEPRPQSRGPSHKLTMTPSKDRSNKPTGLICNRLPSVREQQMRQIIITISSMSDLSNPASPQARAFNWLVNQDGLNLCPESTQLIQRYRLAVFYFSTNGDLWVACGRQSTVPCVPSLSFVLGDPVLARYSNKIWLSAIDECLWGGLSCNDETGKVDRIEFNRLMGNKLGGTLPVELMQMTTIRFLIIQGCCSSTIPSYDSPGFVSVGGRLPDDIGMLTSLLVLEMGFNKLSGTIPSSLMSLTKLRSIGLSNNRLEGVVPSPYLLQKLLLVHLDDNNFSGPFPDFSASSKLMNVTLEGNNFSGTIPPAMCKLTGASNNYTLKALWADCTVCPVLCCTRCFFSI